MVKNDSTKPRLRGLHVNRASVTAGAANASVADSMVVFRDMVISPPKFNPSGLNPPDLLLRTAYDLSDLLRPLPALRVLESEQLRVGPVEVIGDIGYLLVESVERVA